MQLRRLHELAFRTQPFEEQQQLEFEKHHGIDAWATNRGILVGDPLPHEAEVQLGLQLTIEVVWREIRLQRDQHRPIELTFLLGTKHGGDEASNLAQPAAWRRASLTAPGLLDRLCRTRTLPDTAFFNGLIILRGLPCHRVTALK